MTRVDRLPLAIELAAARLRLFPLAELAGRLDPALPLLNHGSVDQPVRQRTLRDAIAWSHDLLGAPERAVFRRLAVFRGSFFLEAADAVAAGPPVGDVTAIVSNLMEVSLVERPVETDPSRFSMLETIREYALQQLQAAGEEAEFARRPRRVLRPVGRAGGTRVDGPDLSKWIDRLAVEHPNLRAALTWVKLSGATELGMPMAGRMWRFWQFGSWCDPGRVEAGGWDAPVGRVRARRWSVPPRGRRRPLL